LSWFSRVKHRLGSDGDGRKWLLTGSYALNQQIPNHINFQNILACFPYEVPVVSFQKYFQVELKKRFSKSFSPSAEPYFLIAPCASELKKMYPAKHFVKLIRLIIQKTHWKPIFIGVASEAAYIDTISVEVGGLNVAGQLSTDSLVEKLNGCRLFLGNNSGLSHLAGLVGAPTFVLSGPSHPVLTAPQGEKVWMLHLMKVAELSEKKINQQKMDDLTPSWVFDRMVQSGILT
jgi:ADP-heptose:LPS heptosyltransferase